MPLNIYTKPPSQSAASLPAGVKSIQEVTITFAGADGSKTATITATNALTTLHHAGFHTAATNVDAGSCRLTLTNPTTITADRVTASGALIVKIFVIEWDSDTVMRVQSGFITLAGVASNTATIAPVTVANSAVLWAGANGGTASLSLDRALCHLVLTNSTTVTATKGTLTDTARVGYFVIEFIGSRVNSRQTYSATISAASTTANTTISSVANNAILFWGGSSTTTTGTVSGLVSSLRNSATNILHTRGGSTGAVTTTGTVIELGAGAVSNVARASTSISGATSATMTTASTVVAKTAIFFTGCHTTAATTLPTAMSSGAVTSSTVITATKNTSTNNSVYSCERVEFF